MWTWIKEFFGIGLKVEQEIVKDVKIVKAEAEHAAKAVKTEVDAIVEKLPKLASKKKKPTSVKNKRATNK